MVINEVPFDSKSCGQPTNLVWLCSVLGRQLKMENGECNNSEQGNAFPKESQEPELEKNDLVREGNSTTCELFLTLIYVFYD